MSRILKLKAKIFEAARISGFVDPFMGHVPESERALSGLLAFYGQRDRIDWAKIRLFDASSQEPTSIAANLLFQPRGSYISEYLLMHSTAEELNLWGQMPADVMYLSSDATTAVLWENKVGSHIGYGPAPNENQFARQLQYLQAVHNRSSSIKRTAFVLVSGAAMLEANWYKRELQETLNHMPDLVAACYTVAWESIFRAKVE